MNLRKIGAVLVGILLAMTGMVTPLSVAQANDDPPVTVLHYMQYDWNPGCGPVGVSRCGYVYVASNHQTVGACDTYADGQGMWAEYYTTSGVHNYVADANGSQSGCSETTPGVIDRFRPCLNSGGILYCLATWRYVT